MENLKKTSKFPTFPWIHERMIKMLTKTSIENTSNGNLKIANNLKNASLFLASKWNDR